MTNEPDQTDRPAPKPVSLTPDELKELQWYRRQFCVAHAIDTSSDESWTQYGCPCCAAVHENEQSVRWHNAAMEGSRIIAKVGWTSIEYAYPEAKAWIEKYFPELGE